MLQGLRAPSGARTVAARSAAAQRTVVVGAACVLRSAACAAAAAAGRRQQRSIAARASTGADADDAVDAEAAMALLQREGWKVLDVRPPRDVEAARITKPARVTVAVPWSGDGSADAFAAAVRRELPSASARLLVMDADGGAAADGALAALRGAGGLGGGGAAATAKKLAGGYAGWTAVWTPSGKRRPPPGRWVPTGKEALKAATNIPGAAESYEEGGNLAAARYARGFTEPGEGLPPMAP